MERTRKRVSNTDVFALSSQFLDYEPEYQYVLLVDREVTTDEEHPWYAWREVVKNTASRGFTTGVEIGGNFTSVKTRASLLSTDEVYLKASPYRGDYLAKFRGPLIPSVPTLGTVRSDVKVNVPMHIGSTVKSLDSMNSSGQDAWLSVSDTDEELATLGASLVSKLAPTAPHNSVYTSLGELRNDGLPSLPFWSLLRKQKDENFSNLIGGEYLNYQFGIAPTISDVKSILSTVNKADKLWKQYLRDSGRLVRRRMDMDPEISTTTGTLASGNAYIPVGTAGSHWSSVGPITYTDTTATKRWFSAAYLYYVDESSLAGMDGWLERAQYLYGWKPDPSAYYNLTAWSWLLDWFTNTGDVIDNISLYLEDPFLTRWAYIMEETSVTRTVSQGLISNEGQACTAQIRFETNIKKRRRVNPFHLGFKGEALNGHQLAILAALGLTKGRDPGLM